MTCTKAGADTLAPTVPTNLSGSATSGEIDLGWQASTDNLAVADYRIYRNGALIGSVPGDALSYRDTTVSAKTGYSYRVSAVDAANNESPLSNTFAATTP